MKKKKTTNGDLRNTPMLSVELDNFIQDRDSESECLSGPSPGTANHITPLHRWLKHSPLSNKQDTTVIIYKIIPHFSRFYKA